MIECTQALNNHFYIATFTYSHLTTRFNRLAAFPNFSINCPVVIFCNWILFFDLWIGNFYVKLLFSHIFRLECFVYVHLKIKQRDGTFPVLCTIIETPFQTINHLLSCNCCINTSK